MEENAEVITLPDDTAVVETEEVVQDYPEVGSADVPVR